MPTGIYERKSKLCLQDIIGKQFGNFEVIAYDHDEAKVQETGKRIGRKRTYHFYIIKCKLCGKTKVESRNKILCKKAACFDCRMKYQMASQNKIIAEDKIYRNKCNKNNTNKIKHLHNGKNGRKDVEIMINRNKYKIYSGYDESFAKQIAIELNGILSNGGKEAFFEWYNKLKLNL